MMQHRSITRTPQCISLRNLPDVSFSVGKSSTGSNMITGQAMSNSIVEREIIPPQAGEPSTGHGPYVSSPAVQSTRGHGVRRSWTINGDFLTLPREGVARYARELVQALDALVSEGHRLTDGLDLTLVAPIPSQQTFSLRSIPVQVVPEAIRPHLPQVWVQFQLPRHVSGGLLSFCNLAPLAVSRHIVCIHDLQTRLTPESYGRMFRWTHRVMLPLLGRRAAHIVTVSETSRQHLADYGVAARGKVSVGYNGSDHALRWQPDRAVVQPGGRPYVLCIGRTQTHKNPELVRSIAPSLDAAGFDLAIVGAPDRLRPLLGDATNIRYLGSLDDNSLAACLRAAHCLLLPSRFEGFGLPAVEAMAWDCPVVASTAPCLPEICADAALYADPDRPEAWVGAILSLAADPALRARLIAAGQRRAARFTWRAVAETYLSLMAEMDAAKAEH